MAHKQISPKPVEEGGTGASTLTGALKGNGTSAFTGSTLTQYQTLVGGASNAIAGISVGTANQHLTSNGPGLNPSFQDITGDMTRSASATDNAFVRFDGVTGKAIQNSTPQVNDSGEMTNTSQPAFLATLASQATDVTGNNATYTIGSLGALYTEVIDQGGDFTVGSAGGVGGQLVAPVDGFYAFSFEELSSGYTASHTIRNIIFNTSNRDWRDTTSVDVLDGGSGSIRMVHRALVCDLDAGDTCVMQIRINGGTKVVDVDVGSTFSGWLLG